MWNLSLILGMIVLGLLAWAFTEWKITDDRDNHRL
jgi:hypothetical protein